MFFVVFHVATAVIVWAAVATAPTPKQAARCGADGLVAFGREILSSRRCCSGSSVQSMLRDFGNSARLSRMALVASRNSARSRCSARLD